MNSERKHHIFYSNRLVIACVVLILWIIPLDETRSLIAQPAPPHSLVARSGDQSIVLHWSTAGDANLKGYRVFRSTDQAGPFEEPVPAVFRDPHFVDFDVENQQSYFYRVRAVDDADQMSVDSETIEAFPDVLTDSSFLDLVQQTAFDYFWYEANPENGLIKDRNTPGSACSIAAVGFGLSALTVGVDRGWVTREQAIERVLNTLTFFWTSTQGPETNATGYKGFYYHFLNMQTGKRAGTSELSTIDTALLLGGVLHAGAYFDGDSEEEKQVQRLADSLYLRVEWDWAQVRPPLISHGWRPESGFIPFDWGGYNEAMIVYLLALGSPTHTVEEDAWDKWTSTYKWSAHYGYEFVEFPPLFGHQYTHVWFDFRNIRDSYMRSLGIDYFENSRRATLANRMYAIENPNGYAHYSENIWGLTASDIEGGYRARGAPPAFNDDGTIAPTAAGGSYPFTPQESLAALRAMYDTYRTRIWWRYGFRDAFNPARDWFGFDHLGIDQGPIVLMIENHRSEAIWDVFMRNPYVQAGLERAGFETALPTATSASQPSGASVQLFPNPARTHLTLTIEAEPGEEVTFGIYDVLGRRVFVQPQYRASNRREERLIDIANLPAGVYVASITIGELKVSTLFHRIH